MGDCEVKAIRRYAVAGGRLCVIGSLATHDQWMRLRAKPALDDLPESAVVRVGEKDDWMQAIRRACGGGLAMSVEMRRQPFRAMYPRPFHLRLPRKTWSSPCSTGFARN